MDELYQEAMKKGIEVVLESYVDPLLHKIGDKIRGAAKTAKREISIDTNLAFREYLKRAFDACSHVKTVLYRSEKKYLYDFFEVPDVRKIDDFAGTSRKKSKRKANTLDDFLSVADGSRFIILRGTGGVGKSTLMKHLFLDELAQNDLIPVYLQLKDLNDMTDELNFQSYILESLRRYGCELERKDLEYALKSGCFLFLLDGYDEILSHYSGQFFNKLERFCDCYPDNYFIVSSRPRKESDFLGGNRFTVLEACPFTLQQSCSLIKKVGYAPDVSDRFIEALKTGLYKTHHDFAANPLLLIVMLMMFDNYAEIPEKLHVFYEEAFNTMYQKHDVTKEGYRRERKSNIQDYDEFRMIFACFCFISYAQGETEFSWDRLAAIFQQVKEMAFCKSDFRIDAYVDDLMEGLCVLYREGTSYLFTHRSFQEYFTAVFLTRQSDNDMESLSLQLIENDVGRAIDDEVFRLVKGIDEDRFLNNIILPILRNFEYGFSPVQNTEKEKFAYYAEYILGFAFDGDGILFAQKNLPVYFAYCSCSTTNIYEADMYKHLWKILLPYKSERPIPAPTHLIYEIDMQGLLNDPKAVRLLMTTPKGKSVVQFMHLREQLETQKKNRSINLANLMKKKK